MSMTHIYSHCLAFTVAESVQAIIASWITELYNNNNNNNNNNIDRTEVDNMPKSEGVNSKE